MFLSAMLLACLLIASPVMANGSGNWVGQGTNHVAGGYYNANGTWISTGGVVAKVKAPIGGSYLGTNVAGAFSGQKVNSKACAAGFWPTKPYQSATAYGQASQWSQAGVNLGNGNWANGGQSSWAGYSASSKGYLRASAKGNANTIGGTLAGAYSHNTANSSLGMAGAVTGSCGSAYAKGNNGRYTYTGGFGGVNHGSYASNHGAYAGTGGSASYSYNTNGGRCSSGYGFAGTYGVSQVTYNPNTGALTATARSTSFSSGGGNTNANGGVHITSFTTP